MVWKNGENDFHGVEVLHGGGWRPRAGRPRPRERFGGGTQVRGRCVSRAAAE